MGAGEQDFLGPASERERDGWRERERDSQKDYDRGGFDPGSHSQKPPSLHEPCPEQPPARCGASFRRYLFKILLEVHL